VAKPQDLLFLGVVESVHCDGIEAHCELVHSLESFVTVYGDLDVPAHHHRLGEVLGLWPPVIVALTNTRLQRPV
jgi:hypothetical protein